MAPGHNEYKNSSDCNPSVEISYNHIKSDDITIFIETLPIKKATLPGPGHVKIIFSWELMERAGFGKKCEGAKKSEPFYPGCTREKGFRAEP